MAAAKEAAAVKSEFGKKQESLREFQQLRIKEVNLEKDKCTHLYDKRCEWHSEFSVLQELELKAAAERKAEGCLIRQRVQRVKNAVCKFQQALQNVQPTPEFVESLKLLMEDAEREISAIKQHQKNQYEEMMKDEKLLSQEVSALDKRFDSWTLAIDTDAANSRPSTKAGVLPRSTSARDVTVDLPPEVAAFERFVQQSGGHRGGWDDLDHSTFIKYRNKHRGKPSFITELIGFLPTKTEQEIHEHETWYQEYSERNEQKKDVIARWREKKEQEKDEIVANKREIIEGKAETAREEISEERQKEIEQEKQERREQISKWKVERELQKAEEEERKLKIALEKRKQQEMERLRQFDTKKKVDEYKAIREREEAVKREEEFLRHQMELEEKQKIAAVLTARYRDRDLDAVKTRRERERLEKEREEEEQKQRLDKLRSQVEVTATRDPSRLLRPLEGWKERLKDVGTPSGGGAHLLHMPHKAIPSWRQGLS